MGADLADRLTSLVENHAFEKTHSTRSSRREVPMNRRFLPTLLPLITYTKPWLLIMLIIVDLPCLSAVSFYYGANENMLDNFKNISTNKEQSNEELKSVYTFCNILPLLVKSGRIPRNKDSEEICNKLMEILEPKFGKRLPVKRIHNSNSRRLFEAHRRRSFVGARTV